MKTNEMIAIEFGYKPDNYYSAFKKMLIDNSRIPTKDGRGRMLPTCRI